MISKCGLCLMIQQRRRVLVFQSVMVPVVVRESFQLLLSLTQMSKIQKPSALRRFVPFLLGLGVWWWVFNWFCLLEIKTTQRMGSRMGKTSACKQNTQGIELG